MPRSAMRLTVLILLVVFMAMPALSQSQPYTDKGSPPSMAQNRGGLPQGRPPLPGQAAPVPVPPPSVMSNTQHTPEAPSGPAAPAAAPADAPVAAVTAPQPDNITLADVRDRLIASRDLMWQTEDRLRMLEWYSQLTTAQQQMYGDGNQ